MQVSSSQLLAAPRRPRRDPVRAPLCPHCRSSPTPPQCCRQPAIPLVPLPPVPAAVIAAAEEMPPAACPLTSPPRSGRSPSWTSATACLIRWRLHRSCDLLGTVQSIWGAHACAGRDAGLGEVKGGIPTRVCGGGGGARGKDCNCTSLTCAKLGTSATGAAEVSDWVRWIGYRGRPGPSEGTEMWALPSRGSDRGLPSAGKLSRNLGPPQNLVLAQP